MRAPPTRRPFHFTLSACSAALTASPVPLSATRSKPAIRSDPEG